MKKKVRFYDCVKDFSEVDSRLVPIEVRGAAESLEDEIMSLEEGYRILRKAARKSTGDIIVERGYNNIFYSRFAGLPMKCYWLLSKYQKLS